MKNLLEIAKEKKAKLEAAKLVKLGATKNNDSIVLIENGTVVPANEVLGFENGYVLVSGLFASQTSFKEALRLNKF